LNEINALGISILTKYSLSPVQDGFYDLASYTFVKPVEFMGCPHEPFPVTFYSKVWDNVIIQLGLKQD